MFGLIIMLILAMPGGSSADVIENNATGILFAELGKVHLTYQNWKICYHYNLSEYYLEVDEFKLCIDKIENMCAQMGDGNCEIIIKHFRSEYDRMEFDVKKIGLEINRAKRGAPLAFVGKINHWITGIVDEETGEKYENKINEIAAATNEHVTIIKEQTTLIKKSLTTTRASLDTIKTSVFNLNKEMKKMTLEANMALEENAIRDRLGFLTQMATLILIEHKTITENIKGVMGETVKGDFSDTIPIESLVNDLKTVESKLKPSEVLPFNVGNPNLHEMLATITTRARINKQILMIELSIPIVEQQVFKIYQSIPIPIVRENAMFGMQVAKKHFLADKVTEEIIEISERDLNNCIKSKHNLVCQTNAAVLTGDDSSCEATILFAAEPEKTERLCKTHEIPRATYITEIHGTRGYIITPLEKTKIKLTCDESVVQTIFIEKQSVVNLEPNRVGQVGRYKLKQHITYTLNKPEIEAIHVNLKNLKFGNISDSIRKLNISNEPLILNEPGEFDEILDEVNKLEEKEKTMSKIEKIETNNTVHSFSLIGLGTITFFIALAFVYIVLAKLCPVASAIARMARANAVPLPQI